MKNKTNRKSSGIRTRSDAWNNAQHVAGMAGGVAAVSRFLGDLHAGNGTNIGSSVTDEQAEWIAPILADWLEESAREIQAYGQALEKYLTPTAEEIGAVDKSAPLSMVPRPEGGA